MINVEGFKAFHGGLTVKPANGMEPFTMTGDWLYKPEYDCWYGCGESFPADICEAAEVDRVAELDALQSRHKEAMKLLSVLVPFGEAYCVAWNPKGADRYEALKAKENGGATL